jgi:hypothetical protein
MRLFRAFDEGDVPLGAEAAADVSLFVNSATSSRAPRELMNQNLQCAV